MRERQEARRVGSAKVGRAGLPAVQREVESLMATMAAALAVAGPQAAAAAQTAAVARQEVADWRGETAD